MSGYFTENGTDLIDIFKPIVQTTVDSTGSGITITSNGGPLTIQQNTLTKPINISTAAGSTSTISFSQNNVPLISVAPTGITLKSPANQTMMAIDVSGATCSNQYIYGIRNIVSVEGTIYTLLASSPRDVYITASGNCTLVFPGIPPPGTNFRIIRNGTNGTITLTGNSGDTFVDGNNGAIVNIPAGSRMMKFVYYNGKWYTCKF